MPIDLPPGIAGNNPLPREIFAAFCDSRQETARLWRLWLATHPNPDDVRDELDGIIGQFTGLADFAEGGL